MTSGFGQLSLASSAIAELNGGNIDGFVGLGIGTFGCKSREAPGGMFDAHDQDGTVVISRASRSGPLERLS